jgi:hypothetical protein
LIIAYLPIECKEVLQDLSWQTHFQVLNHSKWIENEKDMTLELERGLDLLFQNF